jgi:hypothetical protein
MAYVVPNWPFKNVDFGRRLLQVTQEKYNVIFITTGKINKKEVTVSLSGSSGFYFIK